jgi:hypothetical protein
MARDWFIGMAAIVVGAAAAIAMAAPAQADEGMDPRIYVAPSRHRSIAVHRGVTDAYDRRARIEWVADGVAKVVVNHQPHYVDLDEDYIHQGHFMIDENSWLPASQRLARRLVNPGAYIVVNEAARQQHPADEKRVIKPLFIIESPKGKERKQDKSPAKPFPGKVAIAE